MKNVKVAIAIASIVLLIPVLYLLKVYLKLPQIIPVHFDGHGKPNDYGDKSILLITTAIFSVVAMGIFFLLRNIHKIDPKKNVKYNADTYNKIAIALVVFMAALNIIIISSAVNGSFETGKLLMPLLGIFFAFMGNVMFSLKPNYFVGIRLPWTLESEDNWRKTHQLAGKVWFAGGLLITILSLIFSFDFPELVFFSIITVMALIPMIFSFIEFRKSKKLQA